MLNNTSNMFASSPRTANTPPPAGFGRQRDSQNSWGRSSNDGLMSSPVLGGSSPSEEAPPVPKHTSYIGAKQQSSSDELPPPARPALRTQNSFSRSGTDGDADAKMVRESFIAKSRHSTQAGSPLSRIQKDRSSLMPPQIRSAMSSENSLNSTMDTPSSTSSSSSTHAPSVNTTPRAPKSNTKPIAPSDDEENIFADEPLFDYSTRRVLDYADEGRTSQLGQAEKRPEPKKVLTAAQFKNLRQRETMMSTSGTGADSDSGDDYEDDEDDPALLAQKRRIQQEKDARHRLWRQQNKKAVGDHSAPLPPGYPNADRSTPNFTLDAPSIAGASLEEDQDDEVPLGILVQHGFPSKKNPPSEQYRTRSYIGIPQGQGSPSQGRPVSSFRLPPFARKLPEDPYLGSSDLVNQVNRQSLGMGRLGGQSTYGGSGREGSPMGSVPPGGLVGVIQEEERLKSMRRGSPNYNGGYSKPLPQNQMNPQQAAMEQMTYGMGVPLGSMNGQGQYGMMQGMPGSQQYPMMDPLAFAHQVAAIMSASQQNMMGGYMGQPGQMGMPGQMGQPSPGQPGYMGRPAHMSMMGMPMTGLPPPQSRPMSMASRQGSRPPLQQSRTMSMAGSPRPQQPRTMSMMNYQSPMNGYGMQQAYPPSIAPSERSNIGNPGRYRPISTVRNGTDGGSTVTPSSVDGSSPGFLSAKIHTGKKSSHQPVADDQDDTEWANLANKRLNRRG
jgi:hypothetical protein